MEHVSSNWVPIRKPHNCWGCTTETKPPEKMMRVTEADGPKIYSVYWCEKCNAFLNNNPDLFGPDDGFCYGEVGQMISEVES